MRWLIACVLAVSSSFAAADGPVYAEVQLAGGGVTNGELDFYPTFASINAGMYLLPGVGIELFADSGLSSDRVSGFDLELQEAYGIAARFQSPARNGLQGYIVLGAVNYTLDQTSVSNGTAGTSINDDFTGMRASIGLMQRLERMPHLQVSLEYRHYNADVALSVDAVVLGLRVNAP